MNLNSNIEKAVAALATFPRCAISCLPTPLQKMENLSRKFGTNIFIKRDDLTGLAFGGNKARKLDFIMADVIAKGATSVITWAGMQSNWCRQLAAAAAKLGIKPVLLLFKRKGLPSEFDGNYLLDRILGAEIRVTEMATNQKMMEFETLRPLIESIAEKERELGRVPYIMSIGGSMTEGSMTQPLGAIAYAQAMVETVRQADAIGMKVDYLVLASSSASTQAGLMVGAKLLSENTKVIGISVGDSRQQLAGWVSTIGSQALQALGMSDRITPQEVITFDQYFGSGYALLNPETVSAIRTVAELEGILLDPVYTGKAMAGLLDLLGRGYFEPGKNIIFLHSGGQPALFPYREYFAGAL